MAVEIILTLTDDVASLNAAKSIKNYLEALGKRVIHLRFTNACFSNLKLEDKNINISILGHTQANQPRYQPRYETVYGSFLPIELANKLRVEFLKTRIKPAQLKRLRCFGCEIGLLFLDPELKVKKTGTHQLAEHLASKGYNELIVSSFINYQQDTYGSIFAINEDASIELYSLQTNENYQKFQGLYSKATKLIVEIEQLKINFTHCNYPAVRKTIKSQIDRLNTDINNLEEESKRLYSPIFIIKDPIKWLDKDPSFQIRIPVKIKELLPAIEGITKCTDANTEQLTLKNFHTLLDAYLTNQDRKKCYNDYYNHRKLAVIQVLYMRIRQLEPGTKDINFFIASQNKKNKDGDLKVLYHLARLIFEDDTNTWHRHLKSTASSKKLSKTGKIYLKQILEDIQETAKNVSITKKDLR